MRAYSSCGTVRGKLYLSVFEVFLGETSVVRGTKEERSNLNGEGRSVDCFDIFEINVSGFCFEES